MPAIFLKRKTIQKTIQIVQVIGIAIMFIGIAFRLADYSGYTIAFITGAILILFARVNIWWLGYVKKNS